MTCFSDSDPVTRGGHAVLQREIRGASGQPHTIIRDAGHFLQEDKGEELGALLLRVVRAQCQATAKL